MEKYPMALSEQEILDGLGEIIEEIAGVPAAEVTPEKTFVDDLDIDSLSMVEIAVAAQDKFGVEIPDDELKNLKTVKHVIEYVQAQGISACRRGAAHPARGASWLFAPAGPLPGGRQTRPSGTTGSPAVRREHDHEHRSGNRRRHRSRRDGPRGG